MAIQLTCATKGHGTQAAIARSGEGYQDISRSSLGRGWNQAAGYPAGIRAGRWRNGSGSVLAVKSTLAGASVCQPFRICEGWRYKPNETTEQLRDRIGSGLRAIAAGRYFSAKPADVALRRLSGLAAKTATLAHCGRRL